MSTSPTLATAESAERSLRVPARAQMAVPHIVRWSEEEDLSSALVVRRSGGIGYVDEVMGDRDQHGVLWPRLTSRPRQGRPLFGQVHSLRQRRAMNKLLCQVCGGPADQNDDGVLWLLKDHRDDWDGWPDTMAVDEPPVCVPCVAVATKLCPAMRSGAVCIRVREYPVVGVQGRVYKAGGDLLPVRGDDELVGFNDPRVRWVHAKSLLREFYGSKLVPVDELT